LNGTLLTPHDPPTFPEIQEIDKNHVREHNSGRVFESDRADFERKVILGGNESTQHVGSSTSSQRPNFELIQYTTFLTEPANGPSRQRNFGMSEILLKSTEIVNKTPVVYEHQENERTHPIEGNRFRFYPTN
jgi:hypothetical protein